MKPHRLITLVAGVILVLLAVAVVVLWSTGGLNPTFAMYSVAVLAALGVGLRLWFVHRDESAHHDEPDETTEPHP